MTDNFQIIVDSGHGGSDNGASSNGFIEKHLNLQTSLLIESKLKKYFKNVLMTRIKDVDLSLSQRGAFISRKASEFKGRTICLSVHFNAFNGVARGAETIYSIFSKSDLATSILNSILELGMPKRRVFNRKSTRGNFDYYAMHRLTGKAETVIVEPLFIDNREDQEFLKQVNFLDRLADKYVEGLLKYLNIPLKGEVDMYNDKDKIAKWALPSVEKANELGLMIGDNEGNFNPKDGVTREQLAVALVNLYNKLKG